MCSETIASILAILLEEAVLRTGPAKRELIKNAIKPKTKTPWALLESHFYKWV